MSRWLALGLMMLLTPARPASAQYIGIFLDAEATTCVANVGPNPMIDLHLVAVLDSTVTGITGAAFKVVGAPGTWSAHNVLWVPDLGLPLSSGHPLFGTSAFPNGGVAVASDDCIGSERVELGRLVLLEPPTTDNLHLRVTAIEAWGSNCPEMQHCDVRYSRFCVGGGEIVLNGPQPASCQLAVGSATWTGVKTLYKD